MGFQPSFKARILNGDFALHAKLTNMSVPLVIDMLDKTTLADTAKTFLAGQETSTFSCDGFIDVDTATDSTAWTDTQPLTYAPLGLTVDTEVEMLTALRSSYELGSEVAGLAHFTLAGQTDGRTDFGKSLADLASISATTNGTAVDGGASTSGGAVAHLHVTAYSGFTNVIFTIEDSADGSTGWATIGTFTTATAVTSEAITIAGTVRRYTRVVATKTGTGSCTFSAAIARR